MKDQNNHGENILYLTDNTKQKKRFSSNYYPVRYGGKKKRNKHIKQQDTKTENTQRLRKSSWKLAYMIAKIKNLNRMPSE